MPRFLVWPLFAAIMGFAFGGSVFWSLYGPVATISNVADAGQHENNKAASDHADNKGGQRESLWQRTTDDPVALFTFWLAIFTLVLAVSTILLWRAGEKQLAFLRESSEGQGRDMQASIAATNRMADAGWKTASGQRAWMICDDLTAAYDGGGMLLRFAWRNTGMSPALNAHIQADFSPVDFDAKTPPIFAQREDGDGISVGPNAPPIMSRNLFVPKALKDLLLQRQIALAVYSSIRYNDVFSNERRVTQICVRFRPDAIKPHPTEPGEITVEWARKAFGPQNTAT